MAGWQHLTIYMDCGGTMPLSGDTTLWARRLDSLKEWNDEFYSDFNGNRAQNDITLKVTCVV